MSDFKELLHNQSKQGAIACISHIAHTRTACRNRCTILVQSNACSNTETNGVVTLHNTTLSCFCQTLQLRATCRKNGTMRKVDCMAASFVMPDAACTNLDGDLEGERPPSVHFQPKYLKSALMAYSTFHFLPSNFSPSGKHSNIGTQ